MRTIDNFGMIRIIGEIVMHTIDEIDTISKLGFIMSFDYYASTFFWELLIILYSLAFIIGFFYNLAAFIIGTILGGVMIFVHDRIPEFMTYLVLGIHNATHTGVYLLLLPIFVLSIVGIPLLILPAINFTLVFLSVKGLLTN